MTLEQNEPAPASPVSPRAFSRPYREYVAQQRSLMNNANKPLVDGTQLWKQMMIGFACAAILGLIMFLLGAVFISKAMEKKESITIMLCIMGIACGLLIIAGVGVLAKLLITRKTQTCRGRQPPHHAHATCFHTCSVIYTPSQDPLPYIYDPPPAYDAVASIVLTPGNHSGTDGEFQWDREGLAAGDDGDDGDDDKIPPIMVLPPNYDDATKPLPLYQDAVIP